MNASTNTHAAGVDIAINSRLKLQSGIDESATSDVTVLGQSTAAYFYLGSESFVGGVSTPSSSFRTVLYPNKLYLIADPMSGSASHLYLNNTGIICSNGWGYSDKTDIQEAFINAPSHIYTNQIQPNATTTAWNTVTIPALKSFNKLYFVVKVGDYMTQNTFIDKRTNGNSSTMSYSAYSGPGYYACILVSPHFNEGTVSVKWKGGAGWGTTQCYILSLWIHPMDHIA